MSKASMAVPVTFNDGTEHTIRFDNEAIVTLEDMTGKTVLEHATRLGAGSVKAMAVLIWAGTLHEGDKKATVGSITKRLDLTRSAEYGDAIVKAVEEAFGTKGEQASVDEEEEGKAQSRSVDSSIGRDP